MEYRNFGRTGVKVSRLVLGSVNFGTRTEEAESLDMIDHAIDQGINFIDTSNMYGRGVSETTIGKALKRNGQRERIVLATKVYFRIDDDDPNAQGNSRRHIIDQCEKSLKRLQTDWIDLYQIHRPQSEVPIDETLRALDDLVRAGKVRYIGCSTFAAWQVVESLLGRQGAWTESLRQRTAALSSVGPADRARAYSGRGYLRPCPDTMVADGLRFSDRQICAGQVFAGWIEARKGI